ncbi:hypothetical protein AKJ16_DCAP05308 [Drosera capensis]
MKRKINSGHRVYRPVALSGSPPPPPQHPPRRPRTPTKPTTDGPQEERSVRRIAAGRLRSGAPVQGPGGDAGDARALGSREMDPNREGQDHPREAPVVLSHRRRQSSPKMQASRPTVFGCDERRRVGEGWAASLASWLWNGFLRFGD